MLFSAVSENWCANPLTSLDKVKNLIEATTNLPGLKVTAAIDKGDYPLKLKISDEEYSKIMICRDAFYGECNYAIYSNAEDFAKANKLEEEIEFKTKQVLRIEFAEILSRYKDIRDEAEKIAMVKMRMSARLRKTESRTKPWKPDWRKRLMEPRKFVKFWQVRKLTRIRMEKMYITSDSELEAK